MIQEDIKFLLENLSGVDVYPMVIPEEAELPAIMYKTSGYNRDNDSNLSESNIKEHSFRIYVISNSASTTYQISDIVKNGLENYRQGYINSTRIFMIRVRNSIDYYNSTQNTYEITIDINIKAGD